jgi:hypothetical protein
MTESQRADVVGQQAEPAVTAPVALPAGAIGRVVDRTLGRWVAPTFGLLSKLRGARSLHPDGRVYTARVEVTPAAPMRTGRYRGVVRLSRGAGLPEPWPDALGLAVRLFDVDGEGGIQDLLLTSSSPAVGRRHLVFPARGFGTAFYSSVLPVRAGGHAVVIGARPVWTGRVQTLTRLAELDSAVGAELRGFDLLLAQAIGAWTPLARIHLGEAVPAGDSEALRFNPHHQRGGLEPVGLLNAVRRRSYAASQRACRDAAQPSARG